MQASAADVRFELSLGALRFDKLVVSDRWLFENSSLRRLLQESPDERQAWIRLIAETVLVARRDGVTCLHDLADKTVGHGGAPSPEEPELHEERLQTAKELDDAGIELAPISTGQHELTLFSDVLSEEGLSALLPLSRAEAVHNLLSWGLEHGQLTSPSRTALMDLADAGLINRPWPDMT
jgi:hypothetical protein